MGVLEINACEFAEVHSTTRVAVSHVEIANTLLGVTTVGTIASASCCCIHTEMCVPRDISYISRSLRYQLHIGGVRYSLERELVIAWSHESILAQTPE